MTILAYTVPVPNTDLNSVADPEIATALTSIKTWANGNIDATNLSPGFTAAGWTPVSPAGNSTMTSGTAVHALAGTTQTTPSNAAGNHVLVYADSAVTAASPVTVTAASGKIMGTGIAAIGVTSIALGTPGAFVELVSDGGFWRIVGGQQDTGMIPLTVAAGLTASSAPAPGVRLRGDQVSYTGYTLGPVSSGGTIVTLSDTSLSAMVAPSGSGAFFIATQNGGTYAIVPVDIFLNVGALTMAIPAAFAITSGSTANLAGLFYSK